MSETAENGVNKNPSDQKEALWALQPHRPLLLQQGEGGIGPDAFSPYIGRFRSPISVIDRMEMRLARLLQAEFMSSQKHYAEFSSDVPDGWQVIPDYLYAKGVLGSPKVIFEELFNDEPKIFMLRLTAATARSITDGRVDMAGYSRGVSHDFEEAISKVIGELLERYPLTLYQRKDLIRASMAALSKSKKAFLNIRDLAGFAEWQKKLYPWMQFNDNSAFSWVKGEELLGRQSALLPAQLVFWNFDAGREPREPYLRQPNTNGAGGHFTREEAILSGVYENVQRDAFLIHWLNGIVPRRIEVSDAKNRAILELISECERYRFEPVFLDVTSDIPVPAVVCMMVDRSERGPAVFVGGGCGPDPEKAILRSLTESLSVMHWARAQGKSFSLPPNYQPFQREPRIHQTERILLWSERGMFPKIEPFLSGEREPIEALRNKFPGLRSNPKEELDSVMGVFKKKGKGYEIYVYEPHHEVLDALGYHSARTIIPALIPLYLRESNALLGAKRLGEVPARIGRRTEEEFTPWPHPFP